MSLARRLSLVGAVLCVISISIAALVLTFGEPGLDATLLDQLAGWRSGLPGTILRAASDVGYFAVLGPVTLVLAIVAYAVTRDTGRALLLAGATPIAACASRLGKEVIRRERPLIDPDAILHSFSMPSGHATSSSAFAAALILVTPPGWRRTVAASVAVAFTLTVGISRVALGVHFPSDVLAGWCLGAGVTCLLAAIIATRGTAAGRGR